MEQGSLAVITGATGFLGKAIAERLLLAGWHVRGLHRESSTLPTEPWAAQAAWRTTDLLDPRDLDLALEGAELVVHCAGLVSFDPRDKEALYQVNVEMTRNVTLACQQLGVKLVHLSSVAAIGRPKGTDEANEKTDWDESATNSEYARTKHLGEREVWRAANEGLPVLVLNPSLVLGVGPNGRSSLRLVHYALTGPKTVIPGLANWVDVRDVVDLLMLLLEQGVVGQRYIVNAGTLSYQEMIGTLAEAAGKPAPQNTVPLGVLRWLVRLDGWRTRLLGGTRKMTPNMLQIAKRPIRYANQKSLSVPGFRYSSLQETARWIAQGLNP